MCASVLFLIHCVWFYRRFLRQMDHFMTSPRPSLDELRTLTFFGRKKKATDG